MGRGHNEDRPSLVGFTCPFRSSGIVRSVLWDRWYSLGPGMSLNLWCSPRCLHGMIRRQFRNVVHNITRFVVLISNVAWLQLLPVSSPNWAMRNDLDVEAASTQWLLDNRRYPSRILVLARSMVQRIHRISGLVLPGNLGDTSQVWSHLRLEVSLDYLPCAMCAGDGSSESILVRNCLEFNSSLRKRPQDVGVLRYCIRNSWRARFGGREDFLSACLKVCTRRSAVPLVAGWYGAPVKCVIPRSLHPCWNSSEVKVGALSVTSVWGSPKWAKSSSSKSRVALVDVDECMDTWSKHPWSPANLYPWSWLHDPGASDSKAFLVASMGELEA